MLGVIKTEGHKIKFNPFNAELNLICHLLALLGAHHILRVSRIRVNSYLTSHKLVEDLMLHFIGMGRFEICIVDSLTLLVQESPIRIHYSLFIVQRSPKQRDETIVKVLVIIDGSEEGGL